jgi:CHASE2 domain-containing sensor protein
MKMMRFIKPRRKSLVARIRQRRLVATAWVAAGAIGFVLTFLLIHIPEGPAHWSADLLMTYVPRAPTQQRTDIALIYVTEETLAPYPYVAPIDRGFLADLVRAVDQADVKAIGLDFVFDRETEAAKDDDLVAAIRNAAHPVVLGGLDHRSPMSETTRAYQHSFFERVDRAPGHSAKVGHLYFDQHRNPFIISDHVVRSIAPADGEYPKSFAEMLAGADGQPRTVPSAYISWQSEHADGKGLLRRLWDALARPVIGLFGRTESVQTVTETFPSFKAEQLAGPARVFDRDLIKRLLDNRFVLIGGNFSDRDQHLVPFSVIDGQRYPGLFVHAQILAQIFDGRKIGVLALWLELLLALLAALGGFWMGRREIAARHHLVIEAGTSLLLVALSIVGLGLFGLVFPFTTVFIGAMAGVVGGHYSRGAHS